jgi:D-alanyl-lipoteichoic acid acyltransferase DltB (MBOAT superfamily)
MNKNARKALGNSVGRVIASSFPVLVVWMLTGLWHGSHWNYVMWGLFHGVLIILGIVFASFNLKMTKLLHIRTECFSWRLYQMLRTFLLCSIARVFFRANNITDSFHIFSNTLHNWNVRIDIFSLGLDMKDFIVAIASMLVLLVVSNLQEHMKIRETLAKQNLIFRWAIYFAAIFIVIIFGIYGSTSVKTFIYEKF